MLPDNLYCCEAWIECDCLSHPFARESLENQCDTYGNGDRKETRNYGFQMISGKQLMRLAGMLMVENIPFDLHVTSYTDEKPESYEV